MEKFLALRVNGSIADLDWLDAEEVNALTWLRAAEISALRQDDDEDPDITPTIKIALRNVETGETRLYVVEVSLCYDARWVRITSLRQGEV